MTRPTVGLSFKQVRTAELSEGDVRDWHALQESNRLYASPLLSPDYARLVASFREDVRVLIARDDAGALVGILGLHKRPMGLSRAIGAPFDDLSGPLIARGSGLGSADFIAACGLQAYRAEASLDPDAEPGDSSSYLIEAGETSDIERLEARRALHPKRFKNFRRLSRKLDADMNGVDLRWGAPDPARLAQLLAWKRAQFLEDGLVDLTCATHSGQLLQAVAHTPSPDGQALGGYMVELVCRERLLAGHFGIVLNGHFHPWISAYDPALGDYAPGIILLYRLLEHFSETGLKSYNLASGHDHYKKYFAEPVIPTRPLHVYAQSPVGMAQGLGERVWGLLGTREETAAGARLRRRLDHLAACEPGLGARVSGFIYAVRKRSARG